MAWDPGAAFDWGGGKLLRVVSSKVLGTLDVANGNPVAKIALDSNSDVFTASPDGRLVALGDERGFCGRRTDDGSLVFRRDIGRVRSIAFRGDGARLIVGMDGLEARVCDPATGATLLVLAGHGAGVSDARFSPDQQSIATASGDGTVRLWEAQLGIPLKTWHGHVGPVRRLLFTPDGRRLVTGGDDGTVRVWNSTDDWDPFLLKHPHSVYGIAFSPTARASRADASSPKAPRSLCGMWRPGPRLRRGSTRR